MGSRILAAAKNNSKITICCAFMVVAAVGAYACPYAEAAGVQTFGQYSGDGGIIQDNLYYSIQSTDNIGFTNPGQETLSNAISDGLLTIGRGGTRYNATIDANDHQMYKGDKSLQYLDGGMSWDSAYMEGSRMPMSQTTVQVQQPEKTDNQTVNVTPGDSVENTTIFMRPYEEYMHVNKMTMGSQGTYVADKIVEQGGDEYQDYVILNAQASGRGMFSNDVLTESKVGFIGISDNVNFEASNKQHEKVYGNYTANSSTLLESFSDVYMNPEIENNDVDVIQSVHMGAL